MDNIERTPTEVYEDFIHGIEAMTPHQQQLVYFAYEAIKERQGDTDDSYEDAFYGLVQWAMRQRREVLQDVLTVQQRSQALEQELQEYRSENHALYSQMEAEDLEAGFREGVHEGEKHLLYLLKLQLDALNRMHEADQTSPSEERQRAVLQVLFDLPQPQHRPRLNFPEVMSRYHELHDGEDLEKDFEAATKQAE